MKPRFAKYHVTTGVVLIVFTIGIPWYYGNLATYNASYFRFNLPYNSEGVDITTWMLSVFFIGMSLGQLLSGSIANKCGLLKSLLASIIIFDAGIFVTYVSVQHSVLLTIVTLMAVPGFCSGVIFALSFALVADWFKNKHVGLASAFVSMAFSIGAIMYNEMITAVINPHNMAPDVTDGQVMMFFGQQEIMDRYPFVFIPIGILSVLLQFIGFPLLRNPRKDSDEKISLQNNVGRVCNETISDNFNVSSDKTHILKEEYKVVISDNDKLALELNDDLSSISKTALSNVDSYHTIEDECLKLSTPRASDSNTSSTHDMTPRDVLKSGTFYVLWMTSFYMALGYLTITNYYKIFGQVWIEDDNFLTTIGSISTITGACTRLFTGWAIDKLGLKNITIGFSCTSTVMLTFWYLSAQPDPWLYMLLTTSISAIFSSSFVIFPLGALYYFGHRHYPTNYGLVMTSTLFANLMVPLVFPHLLHHVGWYWLFLSVAFMGPIITIVLILFLPNQ